MILGFGDTTIWLPGWKDAIALPVWLGLPLATGVIWLSINATNCSDGVDGVSGSLTGTAIMLLGGLLYAVIGNADVASHLNIPLNAGGANWAIMAFIMVGAVSGYLWYNAPPSQVLMGDAGSRPLGLLIGMLVVATGNPLFLLLVGTVILANGATGLLKVAITRFFGIRILSSIRFPLHDHCRKNLGWSNSQVLVRFMLLHLGLSALLVTLVLEGTLTRFTFRSACRQSTTAVPCCQPGKLRVSQPGTAVAPAIADAVIFDIAVPEAERALLERCDRGIEGVLAAGNGRQRFLRAIIVFEIAQRHGDLARRFHRLRIGELGELIAADQIGIQQPWDRAVENGAAGAHLQAHFASRRLSRWCGDRGPCST